MRFKDLLFGILSRLNEGSQRSFIKRSTTYLVAQKIPLTVHPLTDDSQNKP